MDTFQGSPPTVCKNMNAHQNLHQYQIFLKGFNAYLKLTIANKVCGQQDLTLKSNSFPELLPFHVLVLVM